MKKILPILLSLIMVFSGVLTANAEKSQPEGSAPETNVQAQTDAESEAPLNEETTEQTTAQSEVEPTQEPTEAPTEAPTEEPTEALATSEVLPAVRISTDGNFKIKVYEKKGAAFADIIKYTGKSNVTRLAISGVDGYPVRQIRSKAFSNLAKLISVSFKGAELGKYGVSKVCSKAFFNCKNLRRLSTDAFVKIAKNAVGIYKNKPSKAFTKLELLEKTLDKSDLNSAMSLSSKGGFSLVWNIDSKEKTAKTQVLSDFVNGERFTFTVDRKRVNGFKSSDPKVVNITKNGVVTILKKGEAEVSLKVGKTTLKRVIKVKRDPFISKDGKAVKTVRVLNGKTVKLRINGKAENVDNSFSESENAQVVSDEDEDILKIKGIMRGDTKLKITVNGKEIVLNVKVLKNGISDETMEKIADRIGCQTDYSYWESTVMCSAYSYAYAYRQNNGITRSAGSFWCPGGCTWEGGTYTHYGSSATMLKAIKKSLDKNETCVGLVSVGNSSQHYVTFYDYEGKGDSLDDFKLLDPWDGEVTTGENYGYSYGYHVVTVD